MKPAKPMKLFKKILPALLLSLLVGAALPAGAVTNLLGVAYGNGCFVAVGADSAQRYATILTSGDAVQWTNRSASPFSVLSGVAFGTNTFVAVGANTILTSTNGMHWQSRRWRGDPYLFDVVYASGRFVAVGSGNAVLTSPDGVTWRAWRLDDSYGLCGVAYGNGQFVAAGSYWSVLTSMDAVFWTPHPIDLVFSDVAFGNGIFVAPGQGFSIPPGIWTSPDGSTWTGRDMLTDRPVNRVVYANGSFFAFCVDAVVHTSAYAHTWQDWNAGVEGLQAVTYGAGQFVAVGDGSRMVRSVDGHVWTQVNQPLSPPVIHIQPVNCTVPAGDDAVFVVSASGNPAPAYYWRFQGVDLAALPSHTLRLPDVFTNHAGAYSVVLSNSLGSVTSAVAILTVQTAPPAFDSSPTNSNVLEGGSVCLWAYAHGLPPPTYQWFFAGALLADQTNHYCALFSLGTSQAGPYHVVASNAFGMVTSAVATITVSQQAPVFPEYPYTRTCPAGTNIEFCAVVLAGPPAELQWQRDGVDIPGATFDCLNLFHVLPDQAGLYTVVARNSFGVVTGAVAELTVTCTEPGALSLEAEASSVVEGSPMTFYAWAEGAPPPELFLRLNGTNLALPWQYVYRPIPPYFVAGFSLLETTMHDAGQYSLFATNFAGAAVSPVVALTVTPAGPLDHWSRRNPRPQGNNLLSVACGNGLLVAVGDRGTIVSSPDATNWTVQPLRADVSLLGVSYGDGLFVAVGQGGTILTSPDGSTWTLQQSGHASELVSVAYGNGRFVAVGADELDNPMVLASSDGTAWDRQYFPATFEITDITYGGGLFVAVGSGDYIWTSPDGTVWSAQALAQDADLECVAFLNNRFVAAGENGALLVSPDGIQWTFRIPVTPRRLLGVAYGQGQYVAVGARGVLFTSPDTLNWTQESSSTPDRLEDVIVAEDLLVALGENGTTLISTDGHVWAKQSLGTTRDLDGMTIGNDTVVVVGKHGTILTSTNGLDYLDQISGTTDNLHGVAFDHGIFLAVGEPGTILTSTNASDWIRRETRCPSSLKRAAYGNGLWVAVGTEGTILTSADTIQWTQQDAGTFQDLNAVAFGHGTFVVVGDQSPPGANLLTSTDGVRWVDRSPDIGKNLRAVTFADGQFMALGNDGVILLSPDGILWYFRSSGIFYDGGNLRSATHAEGTWIVVGNDGLILTSTNTVNWTRRASRLLENLHGVEFFQDAFVTIGNRGNVLQSGHTSGARLIVRSYHPTRGCDIAIESEPGLQHRLQASTHLRAWTNLFTFKNSQETTLFLDAEAVLHPWRFYRVVSP